MKLKPSRLHSTSILYTHTLLLNPFLYSTLADGLLSFKCRILLAQLPGHPSHPYHCPPPATTRIAAKKQEMWLENRWLSLGAAFWGATNIPRQQMLMANKPKGAQVSLIFHAPDSSRAWVWLKPETWEKTTTNTLVLKTKLKESF